MRLRIGVGVMVTVAGGLLHGAQRAQEIDPVKVYSVCHVLKNLKELNGKMVGVRGALVSGGHGSFLSGECPSHVTMKGFTWPDVIWLTFPQSSEGRSAVDMTAHERVQKTIKGLRVREGDQVIVTYVGVLEAKDLAESVGVSSTGQVVGFGFGPDNDAPAQLLIRTVMDPSVLRHKD
jgi:hypothetical protein